GKNRFLFEWFRPRQLLWPIASRTGSVRHRQRNNGCCLIVDRPWCPARHAILRLAHHSQWQSKSRIIFSVCLLCARSIDTNRTLLGWIARGFLLTGCFFRNARRWDECAGRDDRTKVWQTDHDFVPCIL